MTAGPTHTPPDAALVKRSPMRFVVVLLPVLLVVAVAGYAAFSLTGDGAVPAAVDIVASGPRFASIEELIDASDVIVEGRIVSVDTGRTITDPANPDAGVTTALFQLEVTTVHRGATSESLIVEQEAALLDGTPIIVNGLEPNRVGNAGFWFLVRGDDEGFPYLALVNEQARILVDAAGRLDEPFDQIADVEELRSVLAATEG